MCLLSWGVLSTALSIWPEVGAGLMVTDGVEAGMGPAQSCLESCQVSLAVLQTITLTIS